MIQRIQSVFILISVLMLSSLFGLRLADITLKDEIYEFLITGIFKNGEKVYDGLPLVLFLSLIIILHVYVLFGYKNRIRQMRVLSFTILVLIGSYALLFYFAYAGFDGATASFRIPLLFPFFAAVLDYLAIRNIGKDEALIRSINRLRP